MSITFSTGSQHAIPNYSQETVDALRDFYIANPHLSIPDIAERSKALFGHQFHPETIRDLSQSGHWQAKRAAAVSANSAEEVAQEVHDIRRIVYEQITNSARNGVFIEGLSLEDVEAVITAAFPDTEEVKIYQMRSSGVDPQMVNAYMNLLSKSKIEVNVTNNSAKTSLQEAIEIAGTIIQNQAKAAVP